MRAQRLPLQKAEGELRSGFRAYLLGGTISTRMYLKQANYHAELLLEKYAEPLSTIAWALYEAAYPQARMRLAWRALLSNLPHDSICGCGVDAVHEEMLQRYRHLDDLGGSIVDAAAAVIRGAMDAADPSWDGSFAVFNPLLHSRSDEIRASLVCGEKLLRKVNFETGVLEEFHPAVETRVPTGVIVRDGAGSEVRGTIHSVQDDDTMRLSLHTQPVMYRGRRVEFSFPARELLPVGLSVHAFRFTYGQPSAAPGPGRMENEFLQVAFDTADASLRVKDRRTGLEYEGLHVFEDGGDAGDEYTWSWPAQDQKVSLDPARASVSMEGSGPVQTMVVRGAVSAPKRLAPDRARRSAERVDIGIESRFSLCPGVPRIDVRTTVTNTAEDHRLRVLFPLGAPARLASAEGIFSVDDRPVSPRDISAFADWVEPPSTNPQKSFVSASSGKRGLAVANRGLPDHEVVLDDAGNAVIALTLLRCVGWLSRPDLLARKGNGGWTLPTPGAQCPGTHVFEYSIIPHAGSWSDSGVLALAHQFAVPGSGIRARRGRPPRDGALIGERGSQRNRAERPQEGGKGRRLHPEALERVGGNRHRVDPLRGAGGVRAPHGPRGETTGKGGGAGRGFRRGVPALEDRHDGRGFLREPSHGARCAAGRSRQTWSTERSTGMKRLVVLGVMLCAVSLVAFAAPAVSLEYWTVYEKDSALNKVMEAAAAKLKVSDNITVTIVNKGDSGFRELLTASAMSQSGTGPHVQLDRVRAIS